MESNDVQARGHWILLRLSCKSMDVRLSISIVLVSKNWVLKVSMLWKGMGFNIRGGLGKEKHYNKQHTEPSIGALLAEESRELTCRIFGVNIVLKYATPFTLYSMDQAIFENLH
jgi:hypothetical protein